MNFPKQIFVKIEKTDGEEYLVADANAFGLVEMGERIKVATYQLVEVQHAEGVAKLTPGKKV